MKVRRLVACILAMIMVFGLCACAGGTPGSTGGVSSTPAQSAPGSAPADPGAGEVQAPETLTLMVNGSFMLPEAGQDDLVAKYKEMTGIDLVINQPAHNEYLEKVNLVFAAGDLPDVLMLEEENTVKFGKNGVLVDLLPYYEGSEVLKSIDYAQNIEPMLVEGQLFGLPQWPGDGSVTYVRQDWLDELGLDAPATYGDFLEMLRQFKTLGDEVIPYIAPGIITDGAPYSMYTPEFFQDANPDFIEVGGEWVDGMMQPEMVAALERWQTAFAEGLIDMEIITNKTSTCRDKQASGIAGVFTYWSEWANTLEDNLQATDPQAALTVIQPIEGVSYVGRIPPVLAMTTACENPNGAFKYFFEFMYDGGDGQMLFTNGVEGVHYEYDGDVIAMLPSKANPTQPAGQTMLLQGDNINGWDDPYVVDERITAANAIFYPNRVIITSSPYAEAKDKHGADLLLKRKEILADIIYGNISIEDGLAKYEQESKTMVDEILAELNA